MAAKDVYHDRSRADGVRGKEDDRNLGECGFYTWRLWRD